MAMYIVDLFSYRARVNNLLKSIDKKLVLEFFCDVQQYEGITATDVTNISSVVESFSDIEDCLNGNADYYFNSSNSVLPEELISELMESLEDTKVDFGPNDSDPNGRYASIPQVIDDEDYQVDCGISLYFIDL